MRSTLRCLARVCASSSSPSSTLRRLGGVAGTTAMSCGHGNHVAAASCVTLQRRFAHDAVLSAALSRELSEELSRSGKPEQPATPAGWRVERAPGKCTFTLHKRHEDEELTVTYCPNEDGGDVNNHKVVATVARGGAALSFDISIDENELVLDSICYYPDAALAQDTSAEAEVKRVELYSGPKVSELDDNLLDAFIKYLEARGLNEQLGEFITMYSFWAEQQEYENWLEKIGKFVS